MTGLPGKNVRAQNGFCYSGWVLTSSYGYWSGNSCREVNTYTCYATGETVEETRGCGILGDDDDDDDIVATHTSLEISLQTIKAVLERNRELAVILACHNGRFLANTTYQAKVLGSAANEYTVTTGVGGKHIQISSERERLLDIRISPSQEQIRWPGQ